MNETLQILTAYLTRVAPGMVLGVLLLCLLKIEARARIAIYLALFILLRDAMTPLGLWSFGRQGLFWIRLSPDPWFLLIFGISCLGLSAALYFLDGENRSLVRWRRGAWLPAVARGLLGAVVVVIPLAVLYRGIALDERGGAVPSSHLAPLLTFALFGNLLEELLFRGYVLGLLSQRLPLLKAGLASGLVFSFCHVFLATTVTGVGYALLLFTLWEGLIAGIVGAKGGVFSSTLTHGGAIFLLSSGLL